MTSAETAAPPDHVIRLLPADAPEATRTRVHVVDERAIAAYAAGIGDTRAEHFDLGRPGGIQAHPVFPVTFEWPLLDDGGPGTSMSLATRHRGLHARHDVRWFLPLVPGTEMRTVAGLHDVVVKKSLSLVTVRLDTYVPSGERAVSTLYTRAYPGVTVEGDLPTTPASPPTGPPAETRPHRVYDVPREGPTVYTECSRIWNPIHTDIRVARASGLPDIVVHGTETLARAVTAVLDDRDLDRWTVSRVTSRFTGMVTPDQTVTVHRSDPRPVDDGGVHLDVCSTRTDGTTVLAGSVDLRPR
ncbi:MaoC/PaaZ C-terminal domain-containing protein [Pseudonocardia endophytica]|uniref:Acyl dehydratase n=1 Tax=Pseudonocardia endophytica TaxID=401976 RepID=A0A4R1HI16_PSEEN|nr:MaoC/PaaZ C-terminal domain-containing protein [Pseudonocardia endophytica]TCK21904.1 acyl dehydratase [Pseudonocardia endophytica]